MKNNFLGAAGHRRNVLVAGLLLAALAVLAPSAQAQLFRGEVTAVDEDAGFFSFKGADVAKPSHVKQFDINVRPDTKFEKVGSLHELRTGDEVVVDAVKKSKKASWQANSVRLFKVRLYQDAAEQMAQPD